MSELLSSLLPGSAIAGPAHKKGTAASGGAPREFPLRDVFRSADLRRVLPGLALSSLLINLCALGLPLGLLQIMDRVLANHSLHTLILLSLGIVGVVLLEEVLRAANGYVTGWLGARFEHAASVNALSRLMRVPLRRLEREEPDKHAERIAAAGKVAEFYSGQALLIIFDLPFVLLFLAIIYFIGGWVVLVPLALLTVFAYVVTRFGSWLRGQVEERNALDDRRQNFLVEVLGGIHSLKTLGMEAQMERRHELLQASNSRISESLAFGSAMAATTGMLFSQVMIVGVVFAGAWGVLAGEMTPGGLAACMMLSVRALQPLRRSLTVWLRYQAFAAAQARLQEIADMPVRTDRGDEELPPVRMGIELRNVSLNRSNGAPLLENLSLQVRANECVGIRGESGSGKTSLLSLINGIDRPDAGEVLVDGRALDEFREDSVQRQIALVPQKGTLVAGTILENMTMFDDRLNERALEIAGKIGLDRIVAGMKLGYETPMGEGKAETMPPGVCQLITIVRALARDPSVIIFDEANASLDIQDDQHLRDYLAGCKGKCTLILVTHRPSLLALADRTFTLVGGRLVEGAQEAGRFEAGARDLDMRAALPERPAHIDDPAVIVGQHFAEPSDFSNCLLPMLEAMNWRGRVQELAEAMPHMLPSLDLGGFCSVMGNLGLLPRHFTGSLAKLDPRLTPCLYVPADRPAMVILERLDNGQFRAVAGANGKETVVAPASGAAQFYLFRRAEKPSPGRRRPTSWFGSLFERFRRHIALAFALTVLSTLLVLAAPLFVRTVYDHVLPSGDIPMQVYLLLGVALALVLNFTLWRLKSRITAHVGGRAEYIMGTGIFQRIVGLPASSTEGASVSRQVGRMRNFESLRDFFLGPLTIIAFEMPANLVIIVVLAVINPWTLLAILGAAFAYAALAWGTRGASARVLERSGRAANERREFLNETLAHMRTIRNSSSRTTWLDRFRELSGAAVMAQYHDHQVHARIDGLARAIGSLTGVAVLAISAYQTIEGQLSSGVMVATMILTWRVTGPMQNFFSALASMGKIRSNMHQIENLMRVPVERETGRRQSIRPASEGKLAFSRVSFRYSSDADPALLGINFDAKAGQFVVITGPNGAGKSSLLKLVERTHIPQAGTIRLDDLDTRQLPIDDLRARLSYMPQNTELFYGTVAQNLRLAYAGATDAEIRWAVEMAGLGPDIAALPEGMETRISNSRSSQLPNGFRQKLGLARAILRPAAVVMLDEPGTGLDAAGEEALLRCIEWLRGRSTLIVVSHRPSHMRLADTVIYMERGSIAAIGPYDAIKDRLLLETKK